MKTWMMKAKGKCKAANFEWMRTNVVNPDNEAKEELRKCDQKRKHNSW